MGAVYSYMAKFRVPVGCVDQFIYHLPPSWYTHTYTHDRMYYVLSSTCNSPDQAAVVSKDSCSDILGDEIYACSKVLVVYAMSYSAAVHINNKVMMFINVNHNAGHSHYRSFHEATTL